MGLVDAMLPKPALDAGKQTIGCPHCKAQFPCKEVENLQGELLLACPHCRHMSLSPPLERTAIVTCDKCRRGFTAVIAAESKGSWSGPGPVEDDPGRRMEQHCAQAISACRPRTLAGGVGALGAVALGWSVMSRRK
ncbi:MAG: hypothetical protein L0211_07615 [Planctomycetaceae bacterium]|nr:hypothetical protein [Planctomycetaceae bacterium]